MGPAEWCSYRESPDNAPEATRFRLGPMMNHAAILVVDDNPDHLELTVMALGDCCDPKDIATATDGVEALDYLFGRGAYAARDTSQQPRLVILDMKLVRLHGLDVLKAVRADPRTTLATACPDRGPELPTRGPPACRRARRRRPARRSCARGRPRGRAGR